MSNIYYSYCCGKYVERNTECPDLIEQGVLPKKGYHCSRCKKQLTVYGNPVLEEDKQKVKEEQKKIRDDNGIRGSKVEKREDGLFLVNKLYPYGDFTEGYNRLTDYWVVFDYYANFVACIKIEHKNGHVYIENDALNERLKKTKLCAIRMGDFSMYGFKSINDLKDRPDILRCHLEQRGWKFDKNGKVR